MRFVGARTGRTTRATAAATGADDAGAQRDPGASAEGGREPDRGSAGDAGGDGVMANALAGGLDYSTRAVNSALVRGRDLVYHAEHRLGLDVRTQVAVMARALEQLRDAAGEPVCIWYERKFLQGKTGKGAMKLHEIPTRFEALDDLRPPDPLRRASRDLGVSSFDGRPQRGLEGAAHRQRRRLLPRAPRLDVRGLHGAVGARRNGWAR
jgi:hypothetical protein